MAVSVLAELPQRTLAQSRYEEDILHGGHTAIFGSFYDVSSGHWGYRCCRRLGRGKKCGPTPALPAPDLLERRALEAEVLEEPLVPADFDSESEEEDDAHAGAAGEEVTGAAAEAAAARAEQVRAEVARVLGAPPGQPLQVLGLALEAGGPTPDGHAVRRAYRRIVLLIHPDKNVGYEERCKEALVRVQEAREAVEASGGASAAPGGPRKRQREGAGGWPPQGDPAGAKASSAAPPPRQRHRRAERTGRRGAPLPDLEAHAEPRPRADFESAGDFVAHVLQHHLYTWLTSGLDAGQPGRGQAVAGAAQSRPAFEETAAAVASLLKILEGGMLGEEPLGKLERMCSHLLAQEYVPANQAYLDLAIGSRTWHADVPSLLEGGCSWGGRKAGVERGRLFQQARVAERLNRERSASASVLDSEDVKGYVTSLKRLLTVAQELRPHGDPSRNCL